MPGVQLGAKHNHDSFCSVAAPQLQCHYRQLAVITTTYSVAVYLRDTLDRTLLYKQRLQLSNWRADTNCYHLITAGST